MSVEAILARLHGLHPQTIDLNLERMERLLGALDHPEQKLPPVIHVAGTNGKGSTVAFLRAFCEAAGLRAHVYTSPHLVAFNERIRVAGQIISDQDLAQVLEDCEAANAGQSITFFEITTAAALLAFSRTPADIVILETGLGGRLDATNVIAQPRLTCITPISMDHHDYLGDDISKIAEEKAGILKPDVACIVASQATRAAEKTLRKVSKDVGAPLSFEGKDWFARAIGGRRGTPQMLFKAGEVERTFPMPALAGRHQVRNASVAIAVADALAPDFDIPDSAIALGLNSVEWPGRLQPITTGPLADALKDGWELWLDGGHNVAAAEVLAQHSRNWRGEDLWLVFGAMAERDPTKFLKPFEAKIQGLRTVAIAGEDKSLSAQAGADAGLDLRMDAKPMDSVLDAVRDIMETAGPNGGRILICGSLYLVGHVLKVYA